MSYAWARVSTQKYVSVLPGICARDVSNGAQSTRSAPVSRSASAYSGRSSSPVTGRSSSFASRTAAAATCPPPQMTNRAPAPKRSAKTRVSPSVSTPEVVHFFNAERFWVRSVSGADVHATCPPQSSNAVPCCWPSRTVASKKSCASFWASSASKNVRCSIWFLLVFIVLPLQLHQRHFGQALTATAASPPAASATQGRTLPRAPVAAGSNGPGYWLPCSAFPKPWLPRSHGMKGRYKAVLHASYFSCTSWRTAAAACSTSCSVFVCEKLNRTTPCSTVPNTLCINGAQCAPARTQMP